ncbi:MAG: TIGR03032 family protein [Phycisphaerales bacterium]|nr:TIGR03032 family protein [Phycisphaerales bacterium]
MAQPPALELTASRGMTAWMARERISIAFTTYQVGKMFMVGLQPDGRLSVYERTFNRCMGLHASDDARTLWMTSLFQLWRFENFVPRGQATVDGYDRLYVPTLGHTTGDVDIHDLHVRTDGTPVFVVTSFNCIATVSPERSFVPLWKPPFISALVGEDRCHLNGMAVDPHTREPAYVTMVSRSDVSDGWRDRRVGGGLLMDVRTNNVIAEGLSMPHSPRVHPDRPDRVWLLNAGTGFLGYVDVGEGEFHEVAFCPGFLRGLTFVGNHALVGLSASRENRTFQGMPLDDNLRQRDAEARCAVHVVNLNTGSTEHWLRVGGIVHELYDVVALRGVIRPMLLGFKTDEIRRVLRVDGVALRERLDT